MRACSLKQGMTTENGGSMGGEIRVLLNRDSSIQRCNDLMIREVLFVNLHDKLAVRIDITTIHSLSVKRHCHVALAIDCDQPTCATEFGYLIENRLRRFLERHSPILH